MGKELWNGVPPITHESNRSKAVDATAKWPSKLPDEEKTLTLTYCFLCLPVATCVPSIKQWWSV